MALDFQIATRYQFSGELRGGRGPHLRELVRGAVARTPATTASAASTPTRARSRWTRSGCCGASAARSCAVPAPTCRRSGSRPLAAGSPRPVFRALARSAPRVAPRASEAPFRAPAPLGCAPLTRSARRRTHPERPALREVERPTTEASGKTSAPRSRALDDGRIRKDQRSAKSSARRRTHPERPALREAERNQAASACARIRAHAARGAWRPATRARARGEGEGRGRGRGARARGAGEGEGRGARRASPKGDASQPPSPPNPSP